MLNYKMVHNNYTIPKCKIVFPNSSVLFILEVSFNDISIISTRLSFISVINIY